MFLRVFPVLLCFFISLFSYLLMSNCAQVKIAIHMEHLLGSQELHGDKGRLRKLGAH
jgi:hypothetical protein